MQHSRSTSSKYSRRACLGVIAGTASLSLVGSAGASDPSSTVNVAAAGADTSGNQSVVPVLESNWSDNTRFEFPPGRYLFDSMFRRTGFQNVEFIGNDATIVLASRDQWGHGPVAVKLGTYFSPGANIHVEGFAVDQSGSNTGGRAFQLHANDDLVLRNVTVEGVHDAPNAHGPFLTGVHTADGNGIVENVRAPGGGLHPSQTGGSGHGPTGLLVSHYHQGTVTVRNCVLGGFPDNGLYCSGEDGQVHVRGGEYRNSNVANVRLRGDSSSIEGTSFVVDQNPRGFGAQRAIRLDTGSGLRVSNVDIDLDASVTDAIRVMPGVSSATIENTSMTLSSGVRDGVAITKGAGSVETNNVSATGARYVIFHY